MGRIFVISFLVPAISSAGPLICNQFGAKPVIDCRAGVHSHGYNGTIFGRLLIWLQPGSKVPDFNGSSNRGNYSYSNVVII